MFAVTCLIQRSLFSTALIGLQPALAVDKVWNLRWVRGSCEVKNRALFLGEKGLEIECFT